MRPAFFLLLIVYMAYAVASNRRKKTFANRSLYLGRTFPKRAKAGVPWKGPETTVRPGPLVFLLQTPLMALACIYAVNTGAVSRDLVNPLYIAAGLLLGHLLFCFSLLATHGVAEDAWEQFLDVRGVGRFLAESPSLIIRFLGVSFAEETIYRVTMQPLLSQWTGLPVLSLLLTAASFSVVHEHFFKNSGRQALEFFVFAVLLGAVYYATGSLSLVIAVHTVRNLESVYLEYLSKVDELGSENAAFEAIEAQYAPRRKRPARRERNDMRSWLREAFKAYGTRAAAPGRMDSRGTLVYLGRTCRKSCDDSGIGRT